MTDTNTYKTHIENELAKLKECIENHKFSPHNCVNFMHTDEFETELSHLQIQEIQAEFIKQAKAYLSETHPGTFIIYQDWCVHICTVEFKERCLETLQHFEQC